MLSCINKTRITGDPTAAARIRKQQYHFHSNCSKWFFPKIDHLGHDKTNRHK